ncbi:hypothetical protein RHMOL_Rhmol06G0140300 [Rhododendron molle]|uniref:Uncharacterized protein n=1 Tax=Rhododendron molle TaxID=49168 RepID=A0ACC0NDQ6_RHOML|nr:hypothetical protein RHMOL_Rhmol06G0140300 [Rhododendron molle]
MLRLYMLLKNAEESEKKTEASEEVPIFSLIDIGNSSAGKFQKQRSENSTRRFPKVVIQKYLKEREGGTYSEKEDRMTNDERRRRSERTANGGECRVRRSSREWRGRGKTVRLRNSEVADAILQLQMLVYK